MIHLALVHVAGPPGVGKTTFIERFLGSKAALTTICVRAEEAAELPQEKETNPTRHPELRRYRRSGAFDAVLYRFPRPDTDAFDDSDAMADYFGGRGRRGRLPRSSMSTCRSSRALRSVSA